MKIKHGIFTLIIICLLSCNKEKKEAAINSVDAAVWEIDFLDNFDTFNSDNWQDQRIWVNNETHCYVPNNEFGTREDSNGTLKLKVVNIGEKQS